MKYIGSKRRISKQISSIINDVITLKSIEKYIEPFCGGCNMTEHIKCESKIASDINEYLIELFNKVVYEGYVPPVEITKDEYLKIRNNKDMYPKELVAVAGFMSSYNARWFQGYAGKVETKKGIRNYYKEAVDNLMEQVDKLKGVEFKHCGYENYLDRKGCLFYLDPPYEQSELVKYKVGKYYGVNFDTVKFWNDVRELSKNNYVIISEYVAPSDFYTIDEFSLIDTINNRNRIEKTEKIFTINEEIIDMFEKNYTLEI